MLVFADVVDVFLAVGCYFCLFVCLSSLRIFLLTQQRFDSVYHRSKQISSHLIIIIMYTASLSCNLNWNKFTWLLIICTFLWFSLGLNTCKSFQLNCFHHRKSLISIEMKKKYEKKVSRKCTHTLTVCANWVCDFDLKSTLQKCAISSPYLSLAQNTPFPRLCFFCLSHFSIYCFFFFFLHLEKTKQKLWFLFCYMCINYAHRSAAT